MTEQKPDPVDLDDGALTAFAARLAAFAQDLDERDRAALDAILLRAMEPLERMHWRNEAELLSATEDASLRALLDQASSPPAASA
jgi:hypothetical protein